MPLNKGFGFVKWQGEGEAGEMYQVAKGKPYQWMSEQGYRSAMEQLRAMASLQPCDLAALMNVSLQDWLEKRDLHPEAYEYIKVLAASQTVQAEPAMTPAGDFLGYMMAARELGMNLVGGSVATVNEPGPIAIPAAMEEVLLAHGGRLLRSTAVSEVVIENGRVCGVICENGDAVGADGEFGRQGQGASEQDGGKRFIESKQVICTIPSRHIFSVLPKQEFPPEWVRTLTDEHWGAGIMTGWGVFKRPIWKDVGLEPSSFIFMPGILHEGYTGAVDMVMTEITAWGSGEVSRGPAGKHDFVFSTALTDEEMRDPDKVGRVIECCENWGRSTFPSWDEDMEFMIWTPAPEGYGIWRRVGSERPDLRSPYVQGLFFAGDQYGKRLWGGGVDAAALSGVMCVDEIMGSRLEEAIFPPCHRGLPLAGD